MEISFFLSTFTALVDRIVKLEKNGKENKQQVFKEIIEPLYLQLQPVAENYDMIFREAGLYVSNNSTTRLDVFLSNIRASQEKMRLTRASIRTMAFQIQKSYNDEIFQNFALNVLRFFDAAMYGKGIELDENLNLVITKTRSTILMNLINKASITSSERDELRLYIFESIGAIEQAWFEIGESYANAKIYCFSASDLMKKTK
jgi:hypothetical protein